MSLCKPTYTYGKDFDAASRSYDQGRIATGLDEMVGMISGKARKPLSEIRLLDAGGGTGNYSKAFLERGIGHVTLLDASPGMLEVAAEKMKKEMQDGKFELIKHALPSLPFADCSFDVICLIFVIHILDEIKEDGTSSYPNLRACIREVYRVLKPDGLIVMTLQTSDQSVHAAWYNSLIPQTIQRLKTRYMPTSELQNVLRENRFRELSAVYRPGGCANISEEIYRNIEGPLSAEWRTSRTIWGMVEEEELESAMAKVKELKDQNKLLDFFRKNDSYRQNYGQEFYLFAKK